MSRHIGFAETSRARNLYLQPDGSQELDESNVPTKHNRGAFPMTDRRFNASDPQSSAVLLGRETGNAMWSPELSALNTYPTQNMGVAYRERDALKTHYGNRWVEGAVTREEESRLYFKRKRAIEKAYTRRLIELDSHWRGILGVLPDDMTKWAEDQLTDLRTDRRQGRISSADFQSRAANITASAKAAIDKIDQKKLETYKSEKRAMKENGRAELAQIRNLYDQAVTANALPVALRKPPPAIPPFSNRLRNSLAKAAVAAAAAAPAATAAKGGRSRRQSRHRRRQQTRRQRR